MDSSLLPRAPARLLLSLALVATGATACDDGTEQGAPRGTPSAPVSTGSPKDGAPEPGGSAAPEEGDPPGQDVVVVTDEGGRATARGRVPGYVRIEEATVEGDALRLVVRVTVAAPIPRTVGADESARVTVGILTEDGTRYSLYAQGSQDGWAGYAVGGEEGPFPGDLEVKGRRITFRMPRDYFGSPPSFRWLVNIAYGKGNAYGFDALPEQGYARFP